MMRSIKINYLCRIIALVFAFSVMPVLAANDTKAMVSHRLIVKLKPAGQVAGLSQAQIVSELRRPFSLATLNKLRAAAGTNLSESHAISNGAHVITLHNSPDRKILESAINNIRGLSEVDYVEEDRILKHQAATNDTYYTTTPYLWGLYPVTAVVSPAPGNTGSYGADFQAAWDTFTGNNVVVAVVDTGITAHPDITGNLISPGYTFITDCRIKNTCLATTSNAAAIISPLVDASDLGDYITSAESTSTSSFFYGIPASNSSWHGTHVSGIVAALGNNNAGVVGGAYTAKILPVRVLGKGGGYTSDITEGIRWAADAPPKTYSNPNAAKVINLSLGGAGACSQTEQDAINAAVNAGAVVVVAAGNESMDVAGASPANCNNVITVAAIGRDGSRASYSNFSSPSSNITNPFQVTLAAQGGDPSLSIDSGIWSTINSGTTLPLTSTATDYGYKSGTSMATPHVAAAAALMIARALSLGQSLTPAQIKTILAASTTAFPSFSTAGWAAYDCATLKNCGAGILNAQLAVQNSITPLGASPAAIDFGTINLTSATVSPVSMTVTMTNSGATLTMGVAKITGADASVFSITADTCTNASIAGGATCLVTLSFLPAAAKTYVGGLLIPAQTATAGAVVVELTGKSNIAFTAPTALAATKSGSGGGGCSILPAYSSQDNSLLFVLLLVILYHYRNRLIFARVKN